MGNEYSDELIRGIPNDTYLEFGLPTTSLFTSFDKNEEREDDYLELSINWYDNEGALEQIYNQEKSSGEKQFKCGGAILKRESLDKFCKNPRFKDNFSYERREVEGNQYHGNLLLKSTVKKPLRNMLASGLALEVSTVRNYKQDTNE